MANVNEKKIPQPSPGGWRQGFFSEFRRQIIAALVAGVIAGFVAAVGAIWAYLGTYIGNVGLVPKDAVVAFAGECPDRGWDEYSEGIGKFIVGAGKGGELIPRKNGGVVPNAANVNLAEHTVGDQGGAERVAIEGTEMPEHQHGFGRAGNVEGATFILGQFFSGSNDIGVVASRSAVDVDGRVEMHPSTASTGGDPTQNGKTSPHENMPPYIALTWCRRK